MRGPNHITPPSSRLKNGKGKKHAHFDFAEDGWRDVDSEELVGGGGCIQRMDEIGEEQGSQHQHISNPLVDRHPCTITVSSLDHFIKFLSHLRVGHRLITPTFRGRREEKGSMTHRRWWEQAPAPETVLGRRAPAR